LEPVRAVFAQIEAAMDRFKPSTLAAGVEADIAALRTEIVNDIALDQWEPALDDLVGRANALLDLFDPTEIVVQIDSGITPPPRPPPRRSNAASLGGLLTSILNGSGLRVSSASFDAVLTWLGGESGTAALAARLTRMADAIAKTRDGVAAFDLDALSPRIIQ